MHCQPARDQAGTQQFDGFMRQIFGDQVGSGQDQSGSTIRVRRQVKSVERSCHCCGLVVGFTCQCPAEHGVRVIDRIVVGNYRKSLQNLARELVLV